MESITAQWDDAKDKVPKELADKQDKINEHCFTCNRLKKNCICKTK